MNLTEKYLNIARKLNDPAKTDSADVEDMTLAQFTESHMALLVKSYFGRICFAANEQVAAHMRAEGFVVYTAEELERIVDKNPAKDELEAIHLIKTTFPGSKVDQ